MNQPVKCTYCRDTGEAFDPITGEGPRCPACAGGTRAKGGAVDCIYCSDTALGFDEDGEHTCGDSGCMPVTRPFNAPAESAGGRNE